MTSNFELDEIIKNLNLKTFYKGCMMKDELLSDQGPKDNEFGIINLNSSNVSAKENSETGHWCLYFRKKDGDGIKNYFFCSYGSPPPLEVIEYLGKPILYHDFLIQPVNTSICGELCVLMAYLLDCDVSYFDAVLSLLEEFQD